MKKLSFTLQFASTLKWRKEGEDKKIRMALSNTVQYDIANILPLGAWKSDNPTYEICVSMIIASNTKQIELDSLLPRFQSSFIQLQNLSNGLFSSIGYHFLCVLTLIRAAVCNLYVLCAEEREPMISTLPPNIDCGVRIAGRNEEGKIPQPHREDSASHNWQIFYRYSVLWSRNLRPQPHFCSMP